MDDFKGLIRSQEKISFLFSFCYGMFNSYEINWRHFKKKIICFPGKVQREVFDNEM